MRELCVPLQKRSGGEHLLEKGSGEKIGLEDWGIGKSEARSLEDGGLEDRGLEDWMMNE